jgi:LacI family transcriptional regulator
MADIAKKLNVSIVSVSKALSGKDGVSEETRQKIYEVADEMGYLKTTAKTNGTDQETVVIIVSEKFFGDSSFYSNMYNTLLQKLNSEGYTTLLEIVSDIREKANYIPPVLNKKGVVSIIFMGEMSRAYIDEIAKKGIPYFFLDFYDANYSINSIIADSMIGSYLLTKHLLDKGLNDITYVGSISQTSSIMDRYLGYCRAMTLTGNKEHIKQIEDRDSNGRFLKIELPDKLPQAFFCNCDEVAFRLIQNLRDKNINVPNDISVVGFDGSIISEISTPAITTYKVNIPDMTQLAVYMVNTLIKHKNVIAKRTIVPGTVVLRDSSR